MALAANTVYYIVSDEIATGDLWVGSGTILNHTSAVTVNGAARSTNGTTWTPASPVADTCYGPVGFKYY